MSCYPKNKETKLAEEFEELIDTLYDEDIISMDNRVKFYKLTDKLRNINK